MKMADKQERQTDIRRNETNAVEYDAKGNGIQTRQTKWKMRYAGGKVIEGEEVDVSRDLSSCPSSPRLKRACPKREEVVDVHVDVHHPR